MLYLLYATSVFISALDTWTVDTALCSLLPLSEASNGLDDHPTVAIVIWVFFSFVDQFLWIRYYLLLFIFLCDKASVNLLLLTLLICLFWSVFVNLLFTIIFLFLFDYQSFCELVVWFIYFFLFRFFNWLITKFYKDTCVCVYVVCLNCSFASSPDVGVTSDLCADEPFLSAWWRSLVQCSTFGGAVKWVNVCLLCFSE